MPGMHLPPSQAGSIEDKQQNKRHQGPKSKATETLNSLPRQPEPQTAGITS